MEVEIFNATAVKRREKINIPYDCQHITIERTGGPSISGALRSGLLEMISVSIVDTRNQPTEIIRVVPLGALAVFSQLGQGHIYEHQKPDDKFVVTVPIRVCELGMHIEPGARLQIVIDDAVIGATYLVRALEVPITGADYIEVISLASSEKSERTSLDVDTVRALVIPALPAISLVRLHFSNGKTFDYSINELLEVNAMQNDVETWSVRNVTATVFKEGAAADTIAVITGSRDSEFVVLNLANVVRVDIDADHVAYDIYQFTNRMLGSGLSSSFEALN